MVWKQEQEEQLPNALHSFSGNPQSQMGEAAQMNFSWETMQNLQDELTGHQKNLGINLVEKMPKALGNCLKKHLHLPEICENTE